MAFGSAYAYHTNTRDVVALAESDEYSVGGNTVVDLVLVGFDNGRRTAVVVGDGINQASPAGETGE